jgi:succinate-semialdehyde dehydrogenase/glutarate-semialdehyde dehydrogenase
MTLSLSDPGLLKSQAYIDGQWVDADSGETFAVAELAERAGVPAGVLNVIAGAKVALGGAPHDLGGCFYQPTILTEVTSEMAVFRNEIFGPVAPVVRFSTEEEVIAMANDTEFGLASYFYTRDIGRVWRVAEALEYGIVGINEGIISNEMAPFGGVKESGSGREGSKYGIDDYVEIKYMLMGGLDR